VSLSSTALKWDSGPGNYELTLSGAEMSLDEREAATVDDIELNL